MLIQHTAPTFRQPCRDKPNIKSPLQRTDHLKVFNKPVACMVARYREPVILQKVLIIYILCMIQPNTNQSFKMSKEAVFTMKLEPELRADFMAETEAAHRPASQVLRELMREFVQRQRDARDYDSFLRSKVDAARISMSAGTGRTNEAVEAEFAARRASVAGPV